MNRRKLARTLAAIPDERVRERLTDLHVRAARQERTLAVRFLSQVPRLLAGRELDWEKMEPKLRDQFICVDPSQGVFLYLLARATRAQRIVEFGTSFGVSTIYLALAMRENGGGVVVTADREPAKVEVARAHARDLGLEPFVDFRVGDALDTLRDPGGKVDLMLNDGFPRFSLPVLRLVEPFMEPGAVVVADNVGVFPADHRDYVAYLRDPANGWQSGMLTLNEGTEMSVRVAT